MMKTVAAFLSIFMGVFAGPVIAENRAEIKRPTRQEVIVTFVSEAHTLTSTNTQRGEDPALAARLFIAEVLYELGIYAEEGPDTHKFSAMCRDGPDKEGVWQCDIALSIKWSDAESAMIAEFLMAPNPASAACEKHRFDVVQPFNPCEWTIPDQSVTFSYPG